MTPVERRRHGDHWWHITPWRAAVLGCWLVLIVTSVRSELNTRRIDRVATAGRSALCIEVNFLENSLITTRELLAHQPYREPASTIRARSLVRLQLLVQDLRRTVRGCPQLKSGR